MISYDIVEFGKGLSPLRRPVPVPAGCEVVMRVAAAGVCHTDVHTRSGSYDLGGGNALRMQERGITLPLTLGHEIVGDVVSVGPEVDAALIGRRYLVYPWIGCGSCERCASGEDNMCAAPRSLGIFRAGGYSDHVLVPDARYLVDIGELSPEAAAPLACSGLTSFSALRRIAPATLARGPIVVIGAGGLGLMSVRLLRAMGGAGAIVLDIAETKREAALEAGALAAFDPRAADMQASVHAAAGGRVCAVLDLVGSAETVQLGLDLLGKGGQLLLVGLAGGELNVSLPLLPLRALKIEGCYVGSLGELRDLVDLVQRAGLPPLPTCCRPLAQAESALADLEAGRVIGRIVLVP